MLVLSRFTSLYTIAGYTQENAELMYLLMTKHASYLGYWCGYIDQLKQRSHHQLGLGLVDKQDSFHHDRVAVRRVSGPQGIDYCLPDKWRLFLLEIVYGQRVYVLKAQSLQHLDNLTEARQACVHFCKVERKRCLKTP